MPLKPVDTLRIARLASGLTKQDAARELGVSARQVIRWESGQADPLPVCARRITEWAEERLEQAGMLAGATRES